MDLRRTITLSLLIAAIIALVAAPPSIAQGTGDHETPSETVVPGDDQIDDGDPSGDILDTEEEQAEGDDPNTDASDPIDDPSTQPGEDEDDPAAPPATPEPTPDAHEEEPGDPVPSQGGSTGQSEGQIVGRAGISGGTLAIVSVAGNPAVAGHLNGRDLTLAASFSVQVSDARGTGEGWHLAIAASPFSTGDNPTRTLPVDAMTITQVTASCTQGTCTGAANQVGYPLTVLADGSPTTFFNALPGTGMGDLTVTPHFTVSVPANAYAGTYTSAFTITVASGP